MSAIIRNRYVKWVLALTAVLCALGSVPSASAQDADPRITGSCTPHTQDQGPWDCKITKTIRDNCLGAKSTGYDEVWKSVRNADDASELLKSMYLKLGGPVKFSQWLMCQGFSHVQIFSTAVEFPGMLLDNQSIHIGLNYDPKIAPFPAPWDAYFFSYGSSVDIDIDNFGQIKKIRQGNTFE